MARKTKQIKKVITATDKLDGANNVVQKTLSKTKDSKSKKAEASKQSLHHVIGKAIAKYRKAAGLSQEKLAEKLNLGNEAVSRMERGIVIPTVERLIEMAEIFDCPVSELLTETSNRPTDEIIYLHHLLSALNDEDKTMILEMVEKLSYRLKAIS